MADYEKLLEALRLYKRPAVAFSGGVDSTFLLKAVMDARGAADAYLLVTAFLPERELAASRELAALIGARLTEIPVDVLADPAVASNPPDRCYHCKHKLFTALTERATADGCDVVMDGSHADDVNDYRPGARALRELNVKSPLMETGFTKARIREQSQALDLPTAGKPAMACLASRFPTNEPYALNALRRVGEAEGALMDMGFTSVRVRNHGDVARVELPIDRLSDALSMAGEISSALKRAGYRYAALDLDGYKMGAMNLEEARK